MIIISVIVVKSDDNVKIGRGGGEKIKIHTQRLHVKYVHKNVYLRLFGFTSSSFFESYYYYFTRTTTGAIKIIV